MDWLKEPDNSVGPTASAYMFPLVSVSEVTVAAVSFHPTMTTFRSPAVCAPVYTAATCDADVGNAAFSWTKLTAGGGGADEVVVVLAVLEYGPKLLATSLARTR